MAMRKKLELNWKGKDYALLVNMEVIDRVEDKISLGVVLSRQLTGDIRFSHVARLISIVLNEAGANTTQEDVYEYMFSDGNVTMQETTALLTYVLSAFFPEAKKKDSLAKKKKAAKK